MRLHFVLATTALLTSACASKQTAAGPEPTPAGAPSADLTDLPLSSIHWSGPFRPSEQQTGQGMTPHRSNRTFGSVELTASPDAPSQLHAEIRLSTQMTSTARLKWALVPGRCGSADLPVIAIEQFPEILVSSNGTASVSGLVPFVLPRSGTYHVNVFWSNGADLSDVMTCANLRMEARR